MLERGSPAAGAGEDEAGLQADAQMVRRLCSPLLDQARRGPLLITLDDVQNADAASMQCLLYLVRRIQSLPILIVLTEMALSFGARPSSQAELVGQPHLRRFTLRWPDEAAAADLVAERLGRSEASRVVSQFHAFTAGNPLLLRALVADAATAGIKIRTDSPVSLCAGTAYGKAVLAFLRRCEPELLRIAQCAAVLGEHASIRLMGHLSGLGVDAVADAVAALEESGVMSCCRLRAEAGASALEASLDGRRRTRLHREAAMWLHREGVPVRTVARHLLVAGGAEDSWAVPVLREAAEQALAVDEAKTAVEYLELAERVCTDARERAKIAASLMVLNWRADPQTAVQGFPTLVGALREGHVSGGQIIPIARYLLWHGRVAEAREALALAVGHPGGAIGAAPRSGGAERAPARDDQETLDELRVTRLWTEVSFPAQAMIVPGDPVVTDAAVPLAVKPRLYAITILASVLRHGTDPDILANAADGAEKILQGSRLTEEAVDQVIEALLALLYGDRLEKAAPWCDLLLEEATNRRLRCAPSRLSAVRAEIALRQGELAKAERYGRAALTLVPRECWGLGIGAPLGTLLFAVTAMGRHKEAAELIKQPVAEAMFQSRFGLHYLHARGTYYLATQQLRAALDDFLACGALMEQWGLDTPALVPWRTEAARALLGLGRPEHARELVVKQLDLAGGRPSRAAGMSLRLLAATGDPRQRSEILHEAVEVLQASGDRLELARALADLGDAHQALGESTRARIMLCRARHIAKKCGVVNVCHAASGGSVSPDEVSGNAGLSDAERRVAGLAAMGHTNREIARRLCVTVSTVEQHLTRVYRKLHVTRRADLPAWLLSEGAESV